MEWISPNQGNILSKIEGKVIEPIKIEIGGSSNYEITKVSGNFPNGISLIENNGSYSLQGTLDLVEETTEYYFTLQAKDLDTEEYIQRWFSMTVETLETSWCGIVYECLSDNINEQPDIASSTIWKEYDGIINDKLCEEKEVSEWESNKNYSIGDLVIYNNNEIFEKVYFQKQFKCKNPEGNERFKKIYGELPNGIFISDTGLLYGVPEEDNDKTYEYKVGVYRNDELILESPKILSIKIDNLSLLNKPLWATDAGIIGYLDYNNSKYLFVKAYDIKGREVKYEESTNDWNTLPGIDFDTDTGEFYGICQTKSSLPWNFSIRPYVEDEGEIIYGDWRRFTIITNAVESDNLIKWVTEELPSTKIGYTYNSIIEATSKNKIFFELSSGNLPKGLKLNKNGNIYGIIDYQNIGEYKFIVRAYTQLSFAIKEFVINVEKGLSQNAVDVALYINKENDEEYHQMIGNFDRSSAYNSSNNLYKISTQPQLYIATLNTWDNILLKYKFEQFNTPIDIIWKEIKKKTINDSEDNPKYDFFYKDFDEIYKDSEEWEIKLHTDNETIMEDKFDNEFRPGYLRNLDIQKDEIRIEYRDINGNLIEDTENIKEEVQEDKTRYYYVDPETQDEYLIQDPKYFIGEREINPKEVDDYAFFPRKYIEDGENRIYVNKLPIGRFYEKVSLNIVPMSESVYVSIETINDEEVVRKYILKNNEEVEVLAVDKEDQYYSYGTDGLKYIDIGNYSEIKEDELEDNYYEFISDKITCKPASINEFRKIFKEPFKPTQCSDHLYYKLSNQEIIYRGSTYDDFLGRKYNLKYNEEKDYYYIEYDGEEAYIFVKARNDIDDIYRDVYAWYNGEYRPLVIRSNALDGEVDYIYYTVYLKDRELPLTNLLFTCEWDPSIKIICEYDSEKDVYQWFKVGEWEELDNADRYIYKASENESYGFTKDIILPNIKSEHIDENGYVKFFNEDIEDNLLPEYMEGTYKPTLPVFFGIPRSHDTKLKQINAYEKEGNYWFGRKFVFYEVHFTPKYLNKDAFTIDFYNHKNPNSPEFLLI